MDIHKLEKAGRVAHQAMELGLSLVRPDESVLSVVQKVEAFINSQGVGMSFPVCININNVAAHFTPAGKDTTVFQSGDVVKIDLGAEVDGYLSDMARTMEVETDNHGSLIAASREAQEAMLEVIKPGAALFTIGSAASTAIEKRGYRVIRNLAGHTVRRWDLRSTNGKANYFSGWMKVSLYIRT